MNFDLTICRKETMSNKVYVQSNEKKVVIQLHLLAHSLAFECFNIALVMASSVQS